MGFGSTMLVDIHCCRDVSMAYGKGKKIPSIASLRSEYAAAVEEKKIAYAGYREARTDMRDLLLARENVNRLMNITGPGRERDTERADL